MMKRKQILCLILAMICLLTLAFPAYAEIESAPLTESVNQTDGGVVSASVAINATNFPDDTFRKYVSTNFDNNSDGTLSADEIAKVTAIDFTPESDTSEFLNITSLQGIKYFTALKELTYKSYDVGTQGKVTSLDLSGCTSLTTLNCKQNSLTTLNVSGCTSLTTLMCYQSNLTTLNASGCTALKKIQCYTNQLTSLDLSGCAALEYLDCSSNKLTTLSLNDCATLKTLYCYSNQLTELDVSHCASLTALYCYKNQLTALDVSGCTALKKIQCYTNQLTSLDLSGCAALEYLDCSSNKLTTLSLNDCASLKTLYCYSNQLTELDVSYCAALEYLDCYSNQLTALDVSKNTALKTLNYRNNSLTSLDISNTSVTTLYSNNNEREIVTEGNTFDLSKLPGFDVSKVSGVEGGEIKNGILTINAEADENGCSTVTYSYDVGKEKSATFKIKFVACKHLTWKEATCTEPKTCADCGRTEGEAKGHTVEILPGKAATATADGLTTGKKCAVCGEILVKQRVIPANSTDVTVNKTTLSDSAYTVEGPVVTVTYTQPCKVGYLDENGNYAAITAEQNGDGSYSFTAPDKVSDVIIVVTGDVNADGSVDSSDVTQLKAAYLVKITLTAAQKFAGDIDGKDGVAANDVTQLKAAFLEKRELTW